MTPGSRRAAMGFAQGSVGRIVTSLLRDEAGQDIVEYALLGAFIGLAGLTAFSLLRDAMVVAYGDWDTGQQNLWVPPDPL